MEPLSVPAAIIARRATRSFNPDRPLDEETLRAILKLATFAPSSFNLQPWRFLVVRTESNRRKLRACAFNQPKVSEAPVVVIVLGYLTPERSHLGPIVDAMTALGILSVEAAAESKGRATAAMRGVENREVWATRSTMLAAATLMIAAESLGVASAPMEGFDASKVREAFGVPDDHVVCCLIALGHASKSNTFPGRLGLQEVCYEEHFGQPWTLGEGEPSA